MTTENEPDAEPIPLADVKGSLDFEDVEFEYDKGVPVLKGIHFAPRQVQQPPSSDRVDRASQPS